MTKKVKLLAISGSLRKNSFNTSVLEALADAVADKAEMVLFPLNDIPPYNQDEDTDTPPAAVAKLRQAIADADGVVISSPEYNYGMSGVLKNALDWASRPYAQSKLIGKAVLTMSVSPAFTGGARAQLELNSMIHAIGGRLVSGPQAVVPSVHEKIGENGFADEASLTFLKGSVDALIAEIELLGKK